MKVQMQAVCTGIKTSKGDFEGRPFDSTTFQLAVDLGQTSSGESIGQVTRPFKLGTSAEFEKWRQYKDSWPQGGVLCDCDFDITAGAGNDSKLVLLGIKPAGKKAA